MLKRKWESRTLNNWSDWEEIANGIRLLKPKYAAFDTETTGLHIILDTPFIFQFGFLDPTNDKRGFTFLIDLRTNIAAKKIIKDWHTIAKSCTLYLGQNVKYDLHMLRNIGIVYDTENLSDTQFYIRYANDALHESEGGPPMALKNYARKYIDGSAKHHEQLLAKEREQIAKNYNIQLKKRLIGIKPPSKYKAKTYTSSVLNNIFSDPIISEEDLEEPLKSIYKQWKAEDLPVYLQNKVTALVTTDMIRYSELSIENLHKYAHLDIVYTLETFERNKEVLEARGNQKAVELENSLIFPFLEMERTGFLADKSYLEESRKKIKDRIIKLRKRFKELAGEEITIGQHDKIKEIINNKFNLNVETTNNTDLELVLNKLEINDKNNPVIEFIKIIAELRTLEKWYSTYIMRFMKELNETDRLYTSIFTVGTVSGRVTSDFQQFPKDSIKDDKGNELFHPRKLVLVPNDCKYLLYLDYSQIELRFQAMYTILVGTPDLNMCRAYMPYKCHNKNNEKFDYNNPEHIKRWNEEWFTDESEELWTSTDIHAATTEAAGYSKNDPNFKIYRKVIGKRVNFAKNYGASLNKIKTMFPEKSEEECKRIDAAYYTAFPGVKTYHNYCYKRAENYSNTSNLFGIKYYNISGHKLRNTLVQGSAAYFLKYRIRALYDYMKENNLKSRFQLQIHDELVFEIKKDDPNDLIIKFKHIMEDWPDALVPIIAEAELTTTNWAEKKEVEL